MRYGSSLKASLCRFGQSLCEGIVLHSRNWRAWSASAFSRHGLHELGLKIDIGKGLSYPLIFNDATDSFAEVFIHGEYEQLLSHLDRLPDCWLDIGTHYGCFSLWLIRERLRQGLGLPRMVLAVDADSRTQVANDILIKNNPQLRTLYRFIHRAIGEEDVVSFVKRRGMGSSTLQLDASESVSLVPTLQPKDLSAFFSEGCDLVKIDVEGAEASFLSRLRRFIPRPRYLLLEWHAWSFGQGCDRLKAMALCEQAGMQHVSAIGKERRFVLHGQSVECGVELFSSLPD